MGLRPEDWRRWRRLRLAALTEAPEAFAEHLTSWTGREDTGTRWRDRLTALPLNVILTVDGDDAGMVSATSPDTAGQISLVSLWVMPWARGRGVGDVAVHTILAWAREQGGGDVLLSVRADNTGAIALYRRNGLVDSSPSTDDPLKRVMRARAVRG